ncbi:hypothetical protein GCM10023191_037580 [Actinoallomurus oryzae]|uniref:Gram-positive cocci surface proteins LPxTG domain-containing protein n=1 Tax=Actinoallomurus oryzae TaxID=502180 RepID=A0ABP8Q4C9_9ACTN
MRVKTLTLTTASAAALTIGLASPALALASTADMIGAVHNQTGFGAHHQGVLHNGMHQVALPKGDDDDDDEGDDDGGGDDAEIGGFHRTRHTGPRGLCGIGGNIGGFAHGCGEEAGDDDDDDEGPGGGDFASEHTSACCAGGGHVRVSRPAPAPAAPAPRRYVPMGAVRTGFGGTQGTNVPLGVAGMSLLLGGAGLLPLARRRLQASARS